MLYLGTSKGQIDFTLLISSLMYDIIFFQCLCSYRIFYIRSYSVNMICIVFLLCVWHWVQGTCSRDSSTYVFFVCVCVMITFTWQDQQDWINKWCNDNYNPHNVKSLSSRGLPAKSRLQGNILVLLVGRSILEEGTSLGFWSSLGWRN